jgi:hypothetical protein
MMDNRSARSGYYQEIARVFLARRGGALVLSPRDQAAIAGWEEKRVPLAVVLEGIGRTFEALRARRRDTRSIPLAFCDREVEAAFAQHRDRAAGRPKGHEAAAARPARKDSARREIAKALEGLDPGEAGIRELLQAALDALAGAKPDETVLERIDADIEEALWAGAAAAEKAEAAAEAKKAPKGRAAGRGPVPGMRSQAGGDEAVRRLVVKSARARRRIPHVALHYY